MGVDSIVAARVPKEIKEHGNEVLARLGLTPTQLINSAYQYVLEFNRLPLETPVPKPGRRVLSPERLQLIYDELSRMQVCEYDYSQGSTLSIKDALAEQLQSKYGQQS